MNINLYERGTKMKRFRFILGVLIGVVAVACMGAYISGPFDNWGFTNIGIESGTIDNTTVGATTPSTGAFTTLTGTGAGAQYGFLNEVEHLLDDDTLTVAESGKVFYIAKAGAGAAADIVVTLPSAAAGLNYIVVDANETAAADVTITAGSGDKINDGSAAASYVHDTDADNYALCHLVAIDDVDWVVWSETGTWANE